METAIDLVLERERTLSSSDFFDILTFATQQANNNGFVNTFLFYRIAIMLLAAMIDEENKEKIISKINSDPLGTWDEMIEDGTISNLNKQNKKDIDFLSYQAKYWLKEYTDYSKSARGLLDSFSLASEDLFKGLLNQSQELLKQNNFEDVIQTANKWGMSNVFATA